MMNFAFLGYVAVPVFVLPGKNLNYSTGIHRC
jgi:hypothetical protein